MNRALTLLCIVLTGCANDPEDGMPVRASLSDGQVIAGQVWTDTLVLESGMGAIDIPMVDVGEVVPVEGAQLESSGGYVTVWLRNGSEFRGKWADPELAMGLEVGGETLRVDVPVSDLVRFQMQGGEVWPDQSVFRVTTTYGDDFLVEPGLSRVVLVNDLGTFSPLLSECVSIRPDGDSWRLELHNGSVLIGEIEGDEVTFGLDVGPEVLTLPAEMIKSMEWQDWQGWDAPPEAAAADWYSNAAHQEAKQR